MKLRRKPPTDDGFVRILQVRNGAVLAERRDGSKVCAHCPFACLAAYEACEFSPPHVDPEAGHAARGGASDG